MVLSTGYYPPDRRVEREARDLLADGHEVLLTARQGRQQPANERVDGVEVFRFRFPFQHRPPLSDMVYYLSQRYTMTRRIIRLCRAHRVDALHVHDLPYSFATVLAGRRLKLPVIFDMHEHYTVMLQMGFDAPAYRMFKPFSAGLLTVLRAEERWACRRAHRVIVVAEEQIARLEALGVPRERILVVTNTDDIDQFEGLPLDEHWAGRFRDEFVILYVGNLNPHRGLDTAIRAMPRILQELPNARLLIVGDGPSRRTLEDLAEAEGVQERVTFAGYQPFQLLPSFIRFASVGLIPHVSTPHIETTMPNKIFQFMIMGRPVLVSSTKPMMRVVADANCGLVFQERDPASLAERVLELRDEALRQRLGENGRSAVESRYNWKTSVRPLLDVYRTLAPQTRTGDVSSRASGRASVTGEEHRA
jgi:glycosyltransferase involved in cell wall biosynthesis